MRRYFAEVIDGTVHRVIVAKEQPSGVTWVETWRKGTQRFHFAGIGYTYDEARDAFIPPKPFESWVLDETTCLWVAPVEMPVETDENGDPVPYVWDESVGEWVGSE